MTPKKINIIIADDHAVYLDGLNYLLSQEKDFEIVAMASNGNELLEYTFALQPDVVVTDLSMPVKSGLDAISEISQKTTTRCIAHTTFSSNSMISDALRKGALGFVVKNCKRGEIASAIRAVYNHDPFYCRITESTIAKLISKSRFNLFHGIPSFSDRDKKIIKLICEEKSSEEIGKELFMAKRTVDGVRSRIITRMNVKSVSGLVVYALKNQLLFIDDLDAST